MKEHFLLEPDIVFLNHGSYGACPRPVFDAWQGWQREIERNPVLFLGRRSATLLHAARTRLATYLGARPDDLVFVPNATTGVNVVAHSLHLQPGDEVLTTDLEYGACRATLARACAAAGARLVVAEIALPLTTEGFVSAMTAAMTARTRLVMMSHITSPTALLLPIEPVLQTARQRGIASLIDGAHAPGQLALALDALGADYYTGNCHKWMCAPKGTAFLHARSDRQSELHAVVTSWGDLAEHGPTPWDGFIGSGLLERRLQWQGTRDITGCLAVGAAIDFHRQHLGPAVRAQCHVRAMALMHELALHFGQAVIGRDDDFAQMAPIPVPPCDAEALRAALFDRHGIEVPVTQHGGRCFVRVSVQGYTTDDELQALNRALRQELAHG